MSLGGVGLEAGIGKQMEREYQSYREGEIERTREGEEEKEKRERER